MTEWVDSDVLNWVGMLRFRQRIEAYIRREFSSPDKRSATVSLIEKTIFSYMKLYSSSTYIPSSNGDNTPNRRKNYDDIDDIMKKNAKEGHDNTSTYSCIFTQWTLILSKMKAKKWTKQSLLYDFCALFTQI